MYIMNKDYLLIKQFLLPQTINNYLQLADYKKPEWSKVGVNVNKDRKIRKDVFYSMDESKILDDLIFKNIQRFVNNYFQIQLQFRETYKIGTYTGKDRGFYNPHTDKQGNMDHREISIVICLSKLNDYKGGLFKFIDLNKSFRFDIGDAIIFKSHLLHGVEPVTEGLRKVLISFMWSTNGEKIRNTPNPINRYLTNYSFQDKKKIFISIACFLDKDIINTIEDCLQKAAYPENITFGICLQYDPNDNFLQKYENHKQFKIFKMNYKKAKGPAFARYICTKLISNEDYYLQIDAHTRFYENWDILAHTCLRECNDKKAIITNFPISLRYYNKNYEYPMNKTSKKWEELSYNTIWQGFGIASDKIYNIQKPQSTFVMSGALVFGPTQFIKEVPYDPLILYGYHKMEQVFYSIRLYTHGWNLYCPTKHILATYYGSVEKYDANNKPVKCPFNKKIQDKSWSRVCYHYKLKELYEVDPNFRVNIKKYGLGTKRSLENYFNENNIYDPINKIKNGYIYKKGEWMNP